MPEEVKVAADWLRQVAVERGIADTVDAIYDRTEGNFLYFAVRLRGMVDVTERAELLIDLEDAWDEREPHSSWHLMLIPGSA